MFGKRGQFYLIAAMVIISIIIGVLTVSNSSIIKKGPEIIYDLEETLKVESGYVLNYGITNNLNNTALMENFTRDFSNNSKGFEFYFIFGEFDTLRVYKYFNGIRETINYLVSNNQTNITIGETTYIFDLMPGENFYYIIFDEDGDKKYIASNAQESIGGGSSSGGGEGGEESCIPDCTGLTCGPDPVCGGECPPGCLVGDCIGGICVVETPQTRWLNWDESSEGGLASDDIFVVLMENTIAGGNELGQGAGLTGADATLTDNGIIAGATGSPPSREIVVDGSDYFTGSVNLPKTIFIGETWSLIIKLKDVGSISGGEDHWASYFRSNDYSKTLGIGLENANNKFMIVAGPFAGGLQYATDLPDSFGVVYYALWSDGIYLRGGFIDSGSPNGGIIPTKWSDFGANDKISVTVNATYNASDWEAVATYGARGYASNGLSPNISYFVMSKSVLIEND